MKDKQFKELLDSWAELVELGSGMAQAIKRYGKYSKYGISPNMRTAVERFENYLKENTTRIKPGVVR